VQRPRILIADEQTLIVEALSSLIASYAQVVGIAQNGRSLLEKVVRLRPDVVLLDLAMPLLTGSDAAQRAKEEVPSAKFIVLTAIEDPRIAASALRTWASGYVLKRSSAAELQSAMSDVLRGHSYVTPRMVIALEQQFIRDPNLKPHGLTVRQREVVQLLAEGRTMKEAASILQITPRTIAFHKYRVMEEFRLHSTSDLVRFAIREHMIAVSAHS